MNLRELSSSAYEMVVSTRTSKEGKEGSNADVNSEMDEILIPRRENMGNISKLLDKLEEKYDSQWCLMSQIIDKLKLNSRGAIPVSI